MKIDCQLDYQTILAHQSQPVHAVLKLTAEARVSQRKTPFAFCAVLDRSSSMQGKALDYARKACETVVKNLGKDDWFSLVVFSTHAHVVFPLQKIVQKDQLLEKVRTIQCGESTNLTAGWMLGRDELKKAPPNLPRHLLLLTDGHLNAGVTDPAQVERIVLNGLEMDQVRTTCLGFGDSYQEDLLRQLAKGSGGDFYDVDSPEKFPVIFREVLQGLQEISAQNVRVRLRPLDFCEALAQLGDYPVTPLPDRRSELAIGDLSSEEDRILVLLAQVLPLPLLHGQPVASLEGEKLMELEIAWDEIGDEEIKSCRHEQIIRISGTQNPEEIKLNEETVTWIAVQRAGRTMEEAIKDVDAHKLDEAKAKLKQALDVLHRYQLNEKTADGVRVLQELLHRLEIDGDLSCRSRKSATYTSNFHLRLSSKKTWSGEAASSPTFSKSIPVEKQLKEEENKPTLPPQTPPPVPEP